MIDWSIRLLSITHRQRPSVLSVCMLDLNAVHSHFLTIISMINRPIELVGFSLLVWKGAFM